MHDRRRTGAALAGLGLLLGATAGCTSGGGGGDDGPRITFATAASSAAEGTSASVEVVLETSAPLAEEVRYELRASAAGSATPGTDFTLPASTEVVFPVGSSAGSQFVAIPLADDGRIEGPDETAELELFDGQRVRFVHELTIEEANEAQLRFVTGSPNVPEDEGTFDLDVELVLAPGDVLETTLSARVGALEGAEATEGTDFRIVDPLLTFGPTDPTTRTLTVKVIDDAEQEIDEMLQLVFLEASPGLDVDGAMYEVEVIENDLTGDSLIGVRLSPSNTTIAPDATVGLGSDGGSVALLVENLGLAPLSLDALTLTGDTRDFRLSIDASLASTPTAELTASAAGSTPSASLPDAAVLRYELPLAGGGSLPLELESVELPFTPDAVVRIDGEDLEQPLEEWLNGLTLWRGHVADTPEVHAFVGLSAHGPIGWIQSPQGTQRITRAAAPGGAPDAFLLESVDALADGPPCRGALFAPSEGTVAPGADGGPEGEEDEPQTAPLEIVGYRPPTCRLAIETDTAFSDRFDSTTDAGTYATLLIAAISEVYEAELQTELSIAYLGLYDGADPWTSTDGGGDVEDLLLEFRDSWTAGGWPASADLAHFLSGDSLGGGIAYVSALCNQSYGFGVSANLNGGLDWNSFTGAASTSNWDFVVVAHELGHNFGSNHTHDYCPPLDRCWANCDGGTACEQGTLMSYCHLCSGGLGNIELTFHAETANVMRTRVSTSCLGSASLTRGTTLPLRVTFEPTSGSGAKTAVLRIPHDTPGIANPFEIVLEGVAD